MIREWKCEKCGTLNTQDHPVCWNCRSAPPTGAFLSDKIVSGKSGRGIKGKVILFAGILSLVALGVAGYRIQLQKYGTEKLLLREKTEVKAPEPEEKKTEEMKPEVSPPTPEKTGLARKTEPPPEKTVLPASQPNAAVPAVPEKFRFSEYEQKLNMLHAQGKMNPVIRAVINPPNLEEFKISLLWLKDKVLNGKGGACYAYCYAYNLARVDDPKMMDMAVKIWLYAKLLVYVDGARGTDPGAWQKKMRQLEVSMKRIYAWYDRGDENLKNAQLWKALELEEQTRSREKDIWLNSGGAQYKKKYLEKHGKPAEDKDLSEDTLELEDETILPDFISDEEWQKERMKVRQEFIEKFRQEGGIWSKEEIEQYLEKISKPK